MEAEIERDRRQVEFLLEFLCFKIVAECFS